MNPQCLEMLKLLLDYVDGTLEDDRSEEFRHHLCGCLPCYIYLDTYQATIRITRSLPQCVMPPEMAARLLAMVCEEQ